MDEQDDFPVEATRRKWAADPRPNEELIARSLALWSRPIEEEDEDEDDGTHELWVIAARGGAAELELLLPLSKSFVPAEREVAAFALARLGFATPAFEQEVSERLVQMLDDATPAVARGAIYGFSIRKWPAAVSRLLAFASSSDDEDREALAHALGNQDGAAAVDTLLQLMRDPTTAVRDWATFAFTSGHAELDSAEIRDALLARTDDEDAEVRGEALIALAQREDSRVTEKLERELSRPLEGDWVFEAADLMGDASLLPLLEQARARDGAQFGKGQQAEMDEVIARLRETD